MGKFIEFGKKILRKSAVAPQSGRLSSAIFAFHPVCLPGVCSHSASPLKTAVRGQNDSTDVLPIPAPFGSIGLVLAEERAASLEAPLPGEPSLPGGERPVSHTIESWLDNLLRYRNWRRIAAALHCGGFLLCPLPLLALLCFAAGIPGTLIETGPSLGWGAIFLPLGIGMCLLCALGVLRGAFRRELQALAKQCGGEFAPASTPAAKADELAAEVGRYNESVGIACLEKPLDDIECEIEDWTGRWEASQVGAGTSFQARRFLLLPRRAPVFCGAACVVFLSGVLAGFLVPARLPAPVAVSVAPRSVSQPMLPPAPVLTAPAATPADTPAPSPPWRFGAVPQEAAPVAATPINTPAPSPPPPQRLTEEQARRFLLRQLDTEQTRRLDDILAGYASRVDYLDHGNSTQDYIRSDKQGYYDRWPLSREHPSELIQMTPLNAGQAWEARFTADFYVESAKRQEWIKGRTQEVYTIHLVDDRPRITAVKGTVLQREKGRLGTPQSPAAASATAGAKPPEKTGAGWWHRSLINLPRSITVQVNTFKMNGGTFSYVTNTACTLREGMNDFGPDPWPIPAGVRNYSYETRYRGTVLQHTPTFIDLRIDQVDFPARSIKGLPLETKAKARTLVGKKWSFNVLPNGNLVDVYDPSCVFEPSPFQ